MSHNIILGHLVSQAHFSLKFVKHHKATLIENQAIKQGKLMENAKLCEDLPPRFPPKKEILTLSVSSQHT